jgi:nucleoside-diphosphate-sugar epimerase
MRVTVIGGAGKIGQWLVRALRDEAGGRTAHEVTVFDRVAGPSMPGVRYVAGDHCDLGQVSEAVAGAECVVHLAALVRGHPDHVTYQNNVVGTFNVHQAAWRLGIRRVVSTSSRSILGWTYRERDFPPAYFPIDEDHPVRPQDPYGLSKQAGEAIARGFTEKCGMETVVLRPSAVMSPEQMQELHASGGREVTRFDTCTYVDVRDVAAAYRLAVERPLPGHTVLWIVADDSIAGEPLCDLLPRLMPEVGDMARELTGTRGSITTARARELLGWQPRRSWRDPASLTDAPL